MSGCGYDSRVCVFGTAVNSSVLSCRNKIMACNFQRISFWSCCSCFSRSGSSEKSGKLAQYYVMSIPLVLWAFFYMFKCQLTSAAAQKTPYDEFYGRPVNIPICKIGSSLSVELLAVGEPVMFACEKQIKNLWPHTSDKKADFCTGPDCAKRDELKDVIVARHDAVTYTLMMIEYPKTPRTLYFACQADPNVDSKGPKCVVKAILEPPQTGDCYSAGGDLYLGVSKEHPIAKFSCSIQNFNGLKPEDKLHVFGEDCTTKRSLKDLVPGAEFQEDNKALASFTFFAHSMPDKTTNLCYLCTATDSSSCKVHIVVPAAHAYSIVKSLFGALLLSTLATLVA